MNVPQQCAECPMSGVAKGFSLSSGQMPPKSGICVLLEAPGPDESIYLVKELIDGMAELQRRRMQYPDVEEKWTRMGAPVVGRSGVLMFNWILRPLALQRSDICIFNTLNCFPGRGADGQFFYPTGNVRKRAEATCASLWLKGLVDWNPTISIVAMHPSAISRDVTPLPVVLRAVERAKVFAAKGERVLLLMGGKAAKHWMGYGENTTRWCNHFQHETDWTRQRRAERWSKNRELSVVKVKREKKLTLKQEVVALLNPGTNVDVIEGKELWTIYISGEDRAKILALCETKKKVKEEVANVVA